MEAWLTSLLLGELSEGEAAAVRELIQHDPELAKLHNRLRQSIALLREAEPKTSEQIAPSEPLRLSDERRKRLLTAFKIPPLKPADRKPKRKLPFSVVEILAVAAILGLLIAVIFPAINPLAGGAKKPSPLTSLPGRLAYLEEGILAKDETGLPAATRSAGNIVTTTNSDSVNVVGYFSVDTSKRDKSAVAPNLHTFTQSVLGQNVAATELAPLPIQYPAPALKGTPEDLPSGPNIEPLGETLATRGGAVLNRPRRQAAVRSPENNTRSSAGTLAKGMLMAAPPAPVASPAPTPSIVLPSVHAESAGEPVVATVVDVPPVSFDFAVPVQSAVVVSAGATGVNWNFDSSGSISAPSSPVSTINGVGVRAENEQLRERFGVALKSAFNQAEGTKPGGVAGGEWYAGDLGMVTTNRIGGQGGTPPLLTTNYLAYADTGGRFAKDNFAYGLFAATDGVASVPGGRGESRTEVAPGGVLDSPATSPLPAVNFATGLPVPSLIDADDISPGGGIYLGAGVVTAKPPATVALGVETDRNRELAEADAKKAPTLGDLPFVRRAFRGTSVSVTNSGMIITNRQTLELAGFNEPNSFVTPPLAANGTMRVPIEAKAPVPYYRVRPPTGGGAVTFASKGVIATNTIGKTKKERAGQRASLDTFYSEARQGAAPARLLKTEPDLPLRRQPSTNAPIPQPEIQTSENNFSTFSLNVSDVSFKLAAASLEKGQMPEPASVRSEEFLNAFDYRDPEPPAGAAIGFTWERARYPFAHNRDLLRFSLKTAAAGRINGRAMNIVLLLDNSGSMERADRVQIIRQALRVLTEQLQPQDKVSVIMFARTARLVADGISGDKAGEVVEQVAGLTPQGGTNLEEAMNLAYATALKHYLAGGINRVVLLTDGAANLGDVEPESLKNKVEMHRRQGIALDAFGIGWEGYNDDLLEVLSRNGDGRYGFINSPEEAATEFAGQLAGALKVAASDVKVQVEFNPRRVTSYRQIGYAKHQLTKEQFRDNTVDAAEIAAQEAGNALYTVEVNPAGDGPLCTVRCRYKVPGTTDYREQAWVVPFTGNASLLEQSSPAMRLAGSAAAFAEWLVASPFAAEVTPDRVLGVMSGMPEVFGVDSRPKKLEWMIRQAKSIEGR